MKTLLILLFSLSFMFGASADFAQKFGYTNDYQKALKLSKETNKPIMMMISTDTCPWCRKLEAQTLRKESVNEYIQKNYIPMSVIKNQDNYPSIFEAPAVPVVYFIDSNEKEIGKIVGYKSADKFLEKLKDTSYTLKPIVKTSPYNIENLKSMKVKFFDRSKTLSKNEQKAIKNKIEKELQAIGIDTNPKEYSNFVIKIESVELEKTKVYNITLRVIEDVIPKRDTNLESIGITYYKNDMFELEDEPLVAINESIFKYLIPEFIKQFQEENPEVK